MGSSISVSDPESEDMVLTSILGILFFLGTELLELASGSESEKIFKVSMIGGRYLEILFSVNINSSLILCSFLNYTKFCFLYICFFSLTIVQISRKIQRRILFLLFHKLVVSTHLYVFLLGSV